MNRRLRDLRDRVVDERGLEGWERERVEEAIERHEDLRVLANAAYVADSSRRSHPSVAEELTEARDSCDEAIDVLADVVAAETLEEIDEEGDES